MNSLELPSIYHRNPRGLIVSGKSSRWKLKLHSVRGFFCQYFLPLMCFLAASAITAWAMYHLPGILREVNYHLFSISSVRYSNWVAGVLLFFFCFYTFQAIFPLLLFMGWKSIYGARKTVQIGAVPYVSIIIPAFNEEMNISRSINAALRQDYPLFEVIVINDGSRDFTKQLVEQTKVKFINFRNNRGKAEALNRGISEARGDIIVFSDSDSELHPKALRYLVRRFSDSSIGAVAGRVVVRKPDSLIRRWQSVEYIYGQRIVKLAQLGFGSSIMISPGPISAFRKNLLISLDGFEQRTLVEDFDTTLKVFKKGFRVVFEPKAIAYTDSPASFKELGSQRVRWSRGNLQVYRIFKELILSRSGGAIGNFWIPFALIFEMGSVLVDFLGLLLMPIILYCVESPMEFLVLGVVYMIMIEALNFLKYIIALAQDGQLRWPLVSAAAMVKPYNFFLGWINLKSIIFEVQGRDKQWTV